MWKYISFLETLLFIPNVGFQDTVFYASGRSQVNFYERAHTQDMIINEAVSVVRVVSLSLIN